MSNPSRESKFSSSITSIKSFVSRHNAPSGESEQRAAHLPKFNNSFGGSIASLKSIFSRNKVQPADFDTTDVVYGIKDFDNYVPPTQKPFDNDNVSENTFFEISNDNQCGRKFLSVLRRAWATRYTEDISANKEEMIKTTIRELFVYIVFLIVLLFVAYGPRSENTFFLTTAMTNIVATSTFNGIVAMDSLWGYINSDLTNALYWTLTTTNPPTPITQIYFENTLVGVPQIRQLRVGSNTCQIPSQFQNAFMNCYSDYSTSNANKSAFGLKTAPAWVYTPPNPPNSYSYGGTFATYDGGGFIQPLAKYANMSTPILQTLNSNQWFDHATRAVFVDFTVYNANVDLYCTVKLIFEFPTTGGVIPSYQIRTIKLLRYQLGYDYFILCCEVLFILFIIYYTIEEILEIKRNRLNYFKKIWNVLDVFMIGSSLLSIGFNFYTVVTAYSTANQLVNNQNNYVSFEFFGIWNKNFNNVVAITAFFGIIKIFKYISFNKTMNTLTDTLGNSLKDILGFSVMFLIVFLSFAQWGYLQFGAILPDFRKIEITVFTLFRLLLGDYSMLNLYQANAIIGPIFFISYVFFIFFVLINMFVAIICDSYEEVKEKLAESKDDFQITKYLQSHIFNRLKKDKTVKIQEVLLQADICKSEQLTFHDWRHELRSRGYAEEEIQALFLQYDIDGDRTLDYEERRRMLNDLKQGKISLGKGDDYEEENEDGEKDKEEKENDAVDEELFKDLVERIDNVEKGVYGVVDKIDQILARLSDIEQAKLDHQKSIGCSLSILTGSQISFNT